MNTGDPLLDAWPNCPTPDCENKGVSMGRPWTLLTVFNHQDDYDFYGDTEGEDEERILRLRHGYTWPLR